MKQGIHPEGYRLVVFKDMSNGTQFLSRPVKPCFFELMPDEGVIEVYIVCHENLI